MPRIGRRNSLGIGTGRNCHRPRTLSTRRREPRGVDNGCSTRLGRNLRRSRRARSSKRRFGTSRRCTWTRRSIRPATACSYHYICLEPRRTNALHLLRPLGWTQSRPSLRKRASGCTRRPERVRYSYLARKNAAPNDEVQNDVDRNSGRGRHPVQIEILSGHIEIRGAQNEANLLELDYENQPKSRPSLSRNGRRDATRLPFPGSTSPPTRRPRSSGQLELNLAARFAGLGVGVDRLRFGSSSGLGAGADSCTHACA
jgi:hypothetical protein